MIQNITSRQSHLLHVSRNQCRGSQPDRGGARSDWELKELYDNLVEGKKSELG